MEINKMNANAYLVGTKKSTLPCTKENALRYYFIAKYELKFA